MLDVLLDALIDSLKMLPFLFAAYFLIEYLEHKASEKMTRSLQSLGPWGPVGGAGLGLVVLFRTNRRIRENLAIVGALYGASVVTGLIVNFIA